MEIGKLFPARGEEDKTVQFINIDNTSDPLRDSRRCPLITVLYLLSVFLLSMLTGLLDNVGKLGKNDLAHGKSHRGSGAGHHHDDDLSNQSAHGT